jgi:hypothetical protein
MKWDLPPYTGWKIIEHLMSWCKTVPSKVLMILSSRKAKSMHILLGSLRVGRKSINMDFNATLCSMMMTANSWLCMTSLLHEFVKIVKISS